MERGRSRPTSFASFALTNSACKLILPHLLPINIDHQITRANAGVVVVGLSADGGNADASSKRDTHRVVKGGFPSWGNADSTQGRVCAWCWCTSFVVQLNIPPRGIRVADVVAVDLSAAGLDAGGVVS